MFKRSILSLLTMILVLTFVKGQEVNAASQFPDVTLYKEEIEYLTDKRIINGYGDGTFGPSDDLTRLQAVNMILREKGITDFTALNPGFTDMQPGDYGYEIVAKAVELGFIGGKTASNGSKFFDPTAPLTRGQMSKILAEGYQLPKTKDMNFSDVAANNTFKNYISILATERITTGYADGTFKPAANLSRAHFAAFMARLLDDKFKPAPKRTLYLDPATKNIILNNITFNMSKSEVIANIGKPKREYIDFEWSQDWVHVYPGMEIFYDGDAIRMIFAVITEEEFYNTILPNFEGRKFSNQNGMYVLYSTQTGDSALYKYENNRALIYMSTTNYFEDIKNYPEYIEIN